MSARIGHRGPDDEGFILLGPRVPDRYREFGGEGGGGALPLLESQEQAPEARVALAHRRFSIIDLSDAGHQPFVDTDGSCCVTFNGEIYNFVELRDELERQGARFRSRCDTEVIVEAYKQWGTGCFERFNGFWALALYDFEADRLILSRDRLGKKPLFWTRCNGSVYFASEIKSLLAVPAVRASAKVDEVVASRWLQYGRKDLDGSTFFEGVRSFPPGAWAVVDESFPSSAQRFWSLPGTRLRERDVPVDEAATQLRELLCDAVRLRLRADVPLAVELSGGLDSSTLAALASQFRSGLTSFTVRWAETRYNEEEFARAVADRHSLDHRVLDPPVDDFWGRITAFTWLEEEPYHSPNLETNQLIWARMREFGVKVSLNGAAGDELFGGYAGYYTRAQVEHFIRGRWRALYRNASRYSEVGRSPEAWLSPLLSAARSAARNGLPPHLLARLRRPRFMRSLPVVPEPFRAATLSRALYDDMSNTQMPYWLISGDRGYMGVPIEVRAPLLDYRVVDYAFRLPATYLIRDGWHKWILRKAMEGLLPESVVWRRRKLGFPFPYESFYARNARIVNRLIAEAQNPYVDTSEPERISSNWHALSFLLWYELFFNDNRRLLEELEEMAGAHRMEADAYVPAYVGTSAGA